MEKKDTIQNKLSEEKKPAELPANIACDKINPYKIMLIVDITKAGRTYSLGMAEEFKDLIKVKYAGYIAEKNKIIKLDNKFSFNNFLRKKNS